MTSPQYTKIISLYEKTIENKLEIKELNSEIKQVRLDLDASFVKDGEEDVDIKEYLNKLIKLRNSLKIITA